MAVEPVPDSPAALVDLPAARGLVIADVHAGIEAGLRRDGVELASAAGKRRQRILELLEASDADRLFVVGDLGHAIGDHSRQERNELQNLVEGVTERVPVTILKGNHDGEIGSLLADRERVTIVGGEGARFGDVGLAHGHTWPSTDVLDAETICLGHEHPVVRLEDEVGGARTERAWLRGSIDPAPFEAHYGAECPDIDGEVVVIPAFNELSGGTWVNVDGQSFLSPFLPEGLDGGEAYLLDGTRLGSYRDV